MAALFTIAKTWKQMSINRRMDKVDGDTHTHTHTMEYYSSIKKKECHLQQHGWTSRLPP